MTAQINANVLKNFIVRTIGADKMTKDQARDFDIKDKDFDEANIDENNYLELDEIIDNSTLYEQFATMYVEEKDNERQTADKEREKEEAMKVQDKGESKA